MMIRPLGPGHTHVVAIFLLLAGVAGAGCQTVPAPASAPAPIDPAKAAIEKRIVRATGFELPTTYEPVPGDALSHHTAGYVKTVCSAVFLTGYTAEFAAEHVGYFTGPHEHRAKVGKPVVDMVKKTVSITLPSGVVRTAVDTGGQGCVTYPEGSDTLSFTPKAVKPSLPSAASQDWPMGDREPKTPMPAGVDMDKVKAAVDAAFTNPDAETTAFVVTYKGRVVGERYGEGITKDTPLESWSMGKSVTGTIMATLIHRGVYALEQPAPVPEWQGEGDKRKEIKIQDIMRMSSGIRIKSPSDPDYDPNGTYPDHLYLYTGGVDSYVRRHTPAAVAAQQRGPLPQLRPRADELPEPARHREAEARLPLLSAARGVGQDRRPHDGDGDRSFRQLPDAGLRVHVRARLGAAGQPLPERRRDAGWRTHPARRLCRPRQHDRTGMARRRESGLRRRVLLGER